MRTRRLGRTGITVSSLGLGTVSLGSDYGISAPGEFGRPPEEEAIAVLRAARERGVTFFDTAPAYGDAERLLGEAFAGRADVTAATKVAWTQGSTEESLRRSLEQSRQRLRAERLTVVQVHNATTEMIEEGGLVESLLRLRRDGLVAWTGASVYGEDAAMAAVRSGAFDVLQVAMSILDQRMRRRVLPAAARADVGIIVRSALLKGALSPKGVHLPASQAPLRDAVDRVRREMGCRWEDLPQLALRFCLGIPSVSTVLIGARTGPELEEALSGWTQPALSPEEMRTLDRLAVDDDRVVNPALWPAA